MRSPYARAAAVAVALAAALPLAADAVAADARDAVGGELSPQRKADLVYLIRQDCGSCHGMTLKGGLGPSLLPDALAGKPDDALADAILAGRTGSPMPPWLGLVTEREAHWMVKVLKQGIEP
jgi:cytochrome c55X